MKNLIFKENYEIDFVLVIRNYNRLKGICGTKEINIDFNIHGCNNLLSE